MNPNEKTNGTPVPLKTPDEHRQFPSLTYLDLPNGNFALCAGEFSSREALEQNAKALERDLNALKALGQLGWEQTHPDRTGGEASPQVPDDVLWQLCCRHAEDFRTKDLLQASRDWPNFQRAWKAWTAAFAAWQQRLFPGLPAAPPRLGLRWHQRLLFAGLQAGRGRESEFYQNHAWTFFMSARLGDVGFFKRLAATKPRKHDPRLLTFHVMSLWMPLALWACHQDAIAEVLQRRFKTWGNNPPHNRGESVRRTWQRLHLWHDPHSRIVGWKTDGTPRFHS
jgi:hypothetical protein